MESQRAPASSIPPESVSICPGCGTGVDSLRAGHVAILDGRFRYFCDAACKERYLGGVPSHEEPTAAPPPVSSERAAPTPKSRPDLDASRDGDPYFPLATSTPTPTSAAATHAEVAAARERREPEREDGPEIGHEVDREPDGQLKVAPAPATDREGVVDDEAGPMSLSEIRETGIDPRRAALVAALTLGAASLAIVVAGERAGAFRLPLAIAASVIYVATEIVRRRDIGESHWALAVWPHGVAIVAASWAVVAHDLHASQLAALVGLAVVAQSTTALVVDRAKEKGTRQRAALVAAVGASARVTRGAALETVLADDVKPGEQVVLEAGDVVAVDGTIVLGEADVVPHPFANGAMKRREGDSVVAGATVVRGSIRVVVTFAGAERALVRVARSFAHRADVASQYVVVARRFFERGVPVVAGCVGVAAYAQNAGIRDVLGAAAAAAIAASSAGVLGALGYCLGRAQLALIEKGVFYKDAASFDSAGRVAVAVLCSRGTLLLGEPEVVAVETVGAMDRDRVLSLAAGAETASSHPFAAAIFRTVRGRKLAPEAVRSAHAHAGLGVTALCSAGERIVVGSRALLLQEKISVAAAEAQIADLEAQGRSVFLVALGGKLVGMVALQDGLRAGARAAVERLATARIEPVLLSGESRETCETIARALDIDHVRPEVMPLDRGAEVRALADGGHVVAVVGHAQSDDGALGAADVSVALSSAGAAPGEWSASTVGDDVRLGVLALTAARRARELGLRVVILGLAPGVVTALGIAFGFVPLTAGPLAALVAVLAAFAAVREPESGASA